MRLIWSRGHLAQVAAAVACALLVACGSGDGESGGPPDLSQIPTATIPANLPEPLVVGQGAVSSGGTQRTYTIQPGDTLATIAGTLGLTVDDLLAANPGVNPSNLRPGDRLRLPEGTEAPTPQPTVEEEEEPEPTNTPVPEPSPTPSSLGQTYIVQPGDIPVTIAEKHGITVEELLAANPGIDPRGLQVGDVLIIPTPDDEGG